MLAEDLSATAKRLLNAHDTGTPTDPIAVTGSTLSLSDAYHVLARNRQNRVDRGETAIGWKVGFTNRTIWEQYGVNEPIWGPMYDTSVGAQFGDKPIVEWRISHLQQPVIEPEIAFRILRTPDPEMAERELLTCIDGVAHGFEFAQSPYAAWKFQLVDAIAAGSMHGNFVHGPWANIDLADHEKWFERLQAFSLTLRRNDAIVDRGTARNVLDGPLSALRHFAHGLSHRPCGRAILPGDIVTTGTITRAFPVSSGQQWSSEIEGLPIAGLSVFCV